MGHSRIVRYAPALALALAGCDYATGAKFSASQRDDIHDIAVSAASDTINESETIKALKDDMANMQNAQNGMNLVAEQSHQETEALKMRVSDLESRVHM